MWQQILHIDQQLLLALNGSWGGFWDTFFYIVTARLTWIPLYAAILYFAWRRIGTRNLLWMLVCLGVAVIAADQICNFFKHYTPKLRPSHTPAIEQFVHTLLPRRPVRHRIGPRSGELHDRDVQRTALLSELVHLDDHAVGGAGLLQPYLCGPPLPDGHPVRYHTRVAARSGGLPDIPQSDGPPAGKRGWKRTGRLPGNAEKP